MDKNKIYKCNICGNVIQVIEGKPVPVVCCGQDMIKLSDKFEGEGSNKHIPILERKEDLVFVKVGAIEHPMNEEHYIQLIQLYDGDNLIGETRLNYFDKPEACFYVKNVSSLSARALCNLHGNWRSDLK